MKKVIRFITAFLHSRFIMLQTTKQAERKGLYFIGNCHGEEIEFTGCRSIWRDEFGFSYKCKELDEA